VKGSGIDQPPPIDITSLIDHHARPGAVHPHEHGWGGKLAETGAGACSRKTTSFIDDRQTALL